METAKLHSPHQLRADRQQKDFLNKLLIMENFHLMVKLSPTAGLAMVTSLVFIIYEIHIRTLQNNPFY